MDTPVAILIFNRPDLTARVFAEIRRAKPSKLLVVADGPRSEEERGKVGAARAVVEEGVDWDCEVLRNYSDVNLGCKRRVSSGLDWVFELCEEAIILEDDCLPHPTFFRFCSELLAKYRDDERIAMIQGTSFHRGKDRHRYSYYFSYNYSIWGWGTWKRSWRSYDVEMRDWPEQRETTLLEDFAESKVVADRTRQLFDKAYSGKIDTWDIQWGYACVRSSALAIVPRVNLISNMGFRKDGTSTKKSNRHGGLATRPMKFPLVHPPMVQRNARYDSEILTQSRIQEAHTRTLRFMRRIPRAIARKISVQW